MKISYCMLTHNETSSLMELIDFIVEHKDDEDEIVILDDYSDNEDTKKILDATVSIYDIKFEQRHLNNDYASQKNYLKNMCTGDYIFNFDADELSSNWLVENIKEILKLNPEIDLYWVQRINTVKGLTQEHIEKWGWAVNDKKWINFPDYQGRIWKNRSNIRWIRPVHERLTGYKEHTYLPEEEQFCFYHYKNINKQEEQNKKYDKIRGGADG